MSEPRKRRWWGDSVPMPKIMFTAGYVGFIAVGILAALAGIPSVSIATPAGYLTPWAVLVAVSAAVASGASLVRRLESVERWAALVLTSLLTVYAAAAVSWAAQRGSPGAAAFAATVVIVTTLPAVRAGSLLRWTGANRRLWRRSRGD